MGNKFPTLKDFRIFLSDERDVKWDSFFKSGFILISKYFKRRDFTKENVRVMLHKLRTTTELRPILLKPSTLNKYVRLIKLIALYMGVSLFADFKGYRVRESEVVPYGELISDREMRAICEAYIKRSRSSKEINLRYRTALSLMRFTGICPVDLCNLTWSVDRGTHFEYFRSKTGRHMIVPIIPEVRRLLDHLERYPHDFIFGSSHGRLKEQSLREEIKLRTNKLGIKKHITPYSFRYSMITYCYINGGEGMIPKIAKISGHTIDTAMKHYVKFDVQVLLDALYSTHPGLIRKAPIDVIKRTIVKLIEHLVDLNKYSVRLKITPKERNVREISLS